MSKEMLLGSLRMTSLENVTKTVEPKDDIYIIGMVNVSNWIVRSFKDRSGNVTTLNLGRNCHKAPHDCVVDGSFAVLMRTNCHQAAFGVTFHLEHPYGYEGDTNLFTFTPDMSEVCLICSPDNWMYIPVNGATSIKVEKEKQPLANELNIEGLKFSLTHDKWNIAAASGATTANIMKFLETLKHPAMANFAATTGADGTITGTIFYTSEGER